MGEKDKKRGGNPRGKPPSGEYPPPYSLRFTFEERQRLDRAAGAMPLSAYIRERLFEHPSPRRRYRRPDEDRAVLRLMLEELSRTRVANNLNQLSRACNSGKLPVSEETEQALQQACADIRMLRQAVLQEMGYKKTQKQKKQEKKP